MATEVTWKEIEAAQERGWQKGLAGIKRRVLEALGRDDFDPSVELGMLARSTTYGVWINKAHRSAELDWFGQEPLRYNNRWYLPAEPNLAVNTGLHLCAQKTFITSTGAAMTPTGIPNLNGVRYGGVDNDVTAVAATTTQFNTTGGNRFIRAWDTTTGEPSYSTANRRITTKFTITNSDTTIVHRRYGLTNDVANAANTLFSMLSGFVLDFNAKAYDITVESQTNFTGS